MKGESEADGSEVNPVEENEAQEEKSDEGSDVRRTETQDLMNLVSVFSCEPADGVDALLVFQSNRINELMMSLLTGNRQT